MRTLFLGELIFIWCPEASRMRLSSKFALLYYLVWTLGTRQGSKNKLTSFVGSAARDSNISGYRFNFSQLNMVISTLTTFIFTECSQCFENVDLPVKMNAVSVLFTKLSREKLKLNLFRIAEKCVKKRNIVGYITT